MELNFKSYGNSGDPVIILHGVFGMLDNWHSFAGQLSENYKVYTVDQRNHGRSPHSENFSYTFMVKDLKSFIKRHQLKKVKLIGHSMGGKTAMHFALKYPDEIDKLVVLDIGIKAYPPRHDYIFDALCSVDLSKYKNRKEIEKELSTYINNAPIRHFLIKNIQRTENHGFAWKMNLNVIKKNYALINEAISNTQSVERNTLFVRGANSGFIQMQDWPGIKKIFPAAELKTIPGASHWLHAEKPGELLGLVTNFFSR